jgi:hypothetical protein
LTATFRSGLCTVLHDVYPFEPTAEIIIDAGGVMRVLR